jgi:hypothetical protein
VGPAQGFAAILNGLYSLASPKPAETGGALRKLSTSRFFQEDRDVASIAQIWTANLAQ